MNFPIYHLHHRNAQLEADFQYEKSKSETLEDKLCTQFMKTQILELELDLHRDALVEKCELLRRCEETIQAQSRLLAEAASRLQNQGTTDELKECIKGIESRIEQLFSGYVINANQPTKKRKIST